MLRVFVQSVSYLKLFFCSAILLLAACSTNHPVPVDDLNALPDFTANTSNRTLKTAVLLLPLHGSFATEGQIVRDGFLAAYRKADAKQHTDVQVIDTQNYPNAEDAYQAAVARHPDLIVGPLTKPEVNAIAHEASLPVTTLVLNQVDPDILLPSNLFQFSLNPQAEAQDTAQKIYVDGYRHVLVIAPSDDWEQAIVNAFNQAWLEKTDEPTHDVRYQNTTDMAAAIKKITADQTPEALQQTAVFSVVAAQDAEKIIPAIKSALPDVTIYILPMTFNGSNQAVLENSRLEVSPWIVDSDQTFKNELLKSDPTLSFTNIGLSAFGADAWALSQFYLHTGHFDDFSLQAYSGYLTMNSQNIIQRQLTWCMIKNNTLVPMDTDTQRSGDET